MVTIQVNGEATTLASECSIADLLRDRQLDRAACAVEVNRRVVPRRQHAEYHVRHGDTVEIVTLVGGG